MKQKYYFTWIQVVFVSTEDIYIEISKDVERRFYTSTYELGHYLEEKVKKLLG